MNTLNVIQFEDFMCYQHASLIQQNDQIGIIFSTVLIEHFSLVMNSKCSKTLTTEFNDPHAHKNFQMR